MTSTKPRYDGGGNWKVRSFSDDEWNGLRAQVRRDLRSSCPNRTAVSDPTFGHPADAWADMLLDTAWGAVSMMRWLGLRLTKAELKAEHQSLLRTLRRAQWSLCNLSHDLDILLGVDADVSGCHDEIRALMSHVEHASPRIDALPPSKKFASAQHDAALEMAIRVLGELQRSGVSTAARGLRDTTSVAVKILKIIGDAIGLQMANATWRDLITKAKRSTPRLKQKSKAPKK